MSDSSNLAPPKMFEAPLSEIEASSRGRPIEFARDWPVEARTALTVVFRPARIIVLTRGLVAHPELATFYSDGSNVVFLSNRSGTVKFSAPMTAAQFADRIVRDVVDPDSIASIPTVRLPSIGLYVLGKLASIGVGGNGPSGASGGSVPWGNAVRAVAALGMSKAEAERLVEALVEDGVLSPDREDVRVAEGMSRWFELVVSGDSMELNGTTLARPNSGAVVADDLFFVGPAGRRLWARPAEDRDIVIGPQRAEELRANVTGMVGKPGMLP